MIDMKCSVCGKKLAGTGQGARTKKRPSRRFGGVLCSSCVERVATLKSRLDDGTLSPDQLDLAYKGYVQQMKVSTEPRPEPVRKAKKPAK